jgi:hypothetical protein
MLWDKRNKEKLRDWKHIIWNPLTHYISSTRGEALFLLYESVMLYIIWLHNNADFRQFFGLGKFVYV